MSLPPRIGAIYALLAKTEVGTIVPRGVESRDPGNIIDDYQITNPGGATLSREKQGNFYSYQHWFKNYPNNFVVKVHAGVPSNFNNIQIGSVSSMEMNMKCPDNWVVGYNPGPPDFDPVPDPNGDIASIDRTTGRPQYALPIVPRWETEDPLDLSGDGLSYNYFSTHGFVPEKGKKYNLYPSNFSEIYSFTGSWDVKVDNLLSEVINYETGNFEYYPFTQETTEFKATAKYAIPKVWDACCWNEGTVIKGKVSIYSADVTTGTLPESGYGFMGMTVEIGTSFSPHINVDWEITITDDYDPVEIEIPKLEGKVTFVNDFWITEIIPPYGA